MPTALVIAFAAAGAVWGLASDRIGARWPAHEDGSVRPTDWRTAVTVVAGALALGGAASRFADPVALAGFTAYLAALVLLMATDLDQRLLPNVITLPAIPLALAFDLAGLNPLVPPEALLIAIVAGIVVPGLLYLASIPFGAGAFGLGDVKLLVSVSLMAGGLGMFTGVLYGTVLAGVVILVLMAARRIGRRSYVPFGPFLILGAMWVILAAPY